MASTLEALTPTTQQLRNYYLTGKGLEELAPPAPFLTEEAAAVAAPEDTSTPVQAAALSHLHAAALAETRQPARAEFRRMLTTWRDKLTNILAVEQTHDTAAVSAQSLTAGLGKDASQFFDTEALSQALSRPASGVKAMPATRRARIESSLAALTAYLRADVAAPATIDYALLEANEVAGRLLEQFGGALRALEVARLEAESQYNPAVHDAAIACIDWRAADTARLAALPPIVVHADPGALNRNLQHLSAIVEGRLPVHVLVPAPALYTPTNLRGVIFGMRHAYLLSSSMGAARHLAEGLRRMAAVTGPAVAIVTVPESADDAAARRQCALALSARLSPLFVWNPEAGNTVVEQFVWECVGNSLAVPGAATAFQSAAPTFRFLPDDAPATLPTVKTRERRQAAYPATLARLDADVKTDYRFWEELAGIGNSIVEAAVSKAKQEAEAAASARAEETLRQARSEGARNAVARLVSVLTNPEASVAQAASAPAAVTAPVAVAAAPAAASASAAAAPAAAPAGAVEDPYIDSFLCTSCNDCMKINPRLFQYNADKQAYIADPSAGTYAELVKAAAGCPAKCIHPGTPR